MSDTEQRDTLKRALFFLKLAEVRLRFVAILVATALVVGYWDNLQNYWERWQRSGSRPEQQAAARQAEYEYFCPMHTFIVRDQPGNCPICGMTLVKRKKGSASGGLPEGTLARVQVLPERVMQAGVQVEPVAYRKLVRQVRTYGSVEPDETRTAKIIARFPGRVERLMVNAVGLQVRKGEPLASIYSPRFLSAAQEYTQALASEQTARQDPQASPEDRSLAARVAAAARERLRLAGFTPGQLEAIARKSGPVGSVTLYSPLSGTVLEKNVLLGDAVEEATPLYTVADLSTVWVQAQVAESDLAAVKVGMNVQATVVSWPGEVFRGVVDFVYPTLNAETRSGKVRMVVHNPGGRLKPGMYVTAAINAPVGLGPAVQVQSEGAPTAHVHQASPASPHEGHDSGEHDNEGRVGHDSHGVASAQETSEVSSHESAHGLTQLPSQAEVWTCPMHPEVISDKPGDCPKCGMHLVKRAKGKTPADKAPKHQHKSIETSRGRGVLAVPETAVVDTGTRQIVYVEVAPGVYDARAVTLGSRAGDYYPVLAGLKEGARVVTRGSFLIDAEARLNPASAGAGGTPAAGPAHQHGGAK